MRAALALICHPRTGKFLAVSRRNSESDLGLPGGKVESHETDAEGVSREVFEETGLKVTSLREVFSRWTPEIEVKTFIAECEDYEAEEKEKGIRVQWVPPSGFCDSHCTFQSYNRDLFNALGLPI